MDSRNLLCKNSSAIDLSDEYEEKPYDNISSEFIVTSSSYYSAPHEEYVIATCSAEGDEAKIFLNARFSDREASIERTNAYIQGKKHIVTVSSKSSS